jgi:hypothetical protein
LDIGWIVSESKRADQTKSLDISCDIPSIPHLTQSQVVRLASLHPSALPGICTRLVLTASLMIYSPNRMGAVHERRDYGGQEQASLVFLSIRSDGGHRFFALDGTGTCWHTINVRQPARNTLQALVVRTLKFARYPRCSDLSNPDLVVPT